jgi:hypothetical protein
VNAPECDTVADQTWEAEFEGLLSRALVLYRTSDSASSESIGESARHPRNDEVVS